MSTELHLVKMKQFDGENEKKFGPFMQKRKKGVIKHSSPESLGKA
jgi:hypothetical protein